MLQPINVLGADHCPETQGKAKRILRHSNQESLGRGRRQNVFMPFGNIIQGLNQLPRIASLDGDGETNVIVTYRKVARLALRTERLEGEQQQQ
jgi:hypothetical protein